MTFKNYERTPLSWKTIGSTLLLLNVLTCGAHAEITQGTYHYNAPKASVDSDGKLTASISAKIPLECQSAFDVFTDFDHMARFLPGLESSKTQGQSGNKITISQSGTFSYGIFVKQYSSTRELTIDAPHRIDSMSSSSDELPISSTALFNESAGSCDIHYTTHIGIPSWAPSFVAIDFAQSIAVTQMRAILAEIKKRNPSAPELVKTPALDLKSLPN